MFRRVRQWFWSRYRLLAEVHNNEKALVELLAKTHMQDKAWNEVEGCYDDLLAENRVLRDRVAAQTILLEALGDVAVMKAGAGE